MPELLSVTAMITTGQPLGEALAFYTGHMGFSVDWQSGTMAGIRRDKIAFNLIENYNQQWAENASFSIGVSDVDSLYEQYRDMPARVGPLEMHFWGRREFHMILPSGVCLQSYTQKD